MDDLGSLSILVVDDNEFSRRVLVMTLGKIGIANVATVDGGVAALRHLAGNHVDAVISDLNMPGMDGAAFIQELAARRFDGGIVLVSGENVAGLDDAQTLARSGGLDYLGACEKPVRPETLEKILRGHPPATAIEQVAPQEIGGNSPPVDLEGLAALIGGDNPVRINETLDLFIEAFPPLISEIGDAIGARNARAVHDAAHKAKGAANNAAAGQLAVMLGQLQDDAIDENWRDFRSQLDRIESEYARIDAFGGMRSEKRQSGQGEYDT